MDIDLFIFNLSQVFPRTILYMNPSCVCTNLNFPQFLNKLMLQSYTDTI